MKSRKWVLFLIIAVFSVMCMHGCGSVQRSEDDDEEQNLLLPRTQSIDVSKVAIRSDLIGNYIVATLPGACEANATIEVGADTSGPITIFAVTQADENGVFTTYNEQPLPEDSANIYLYAKAPGKRRSPAISLENKVY